MVDGAGGRRQRQVRRGERIDDLYRTDCASCCSRAEAAAHTSRRLLREQRPANLQPAWARLNETMRRYGPWPPANDPTTVNRQRVAHPLRTFFIARIRGRAGSEADSDRPARAPKPMGAYGRLTGAPGTQSAAAGNALLSYPAGAPAVFQANDWPSTGATICADWESIRALPSEGTFSRAFAEFAEGARAYKGC